MKSLPAQLIPIVSCFPHLAPCEKRACHLCSCPLSTEMLWWGPCWAFSSSQINDLTPSVFPLTADSSALLIVFVALLWTFSSLSASFLSCGDQTWTQDSGCSLTSTEYCRMIISLYFQWCSCKCNPGPDLPLLLLWLSAGSRSACCLPGPSVTLQQGAPQAHTSCAVLCGYFVPGAGL